MIMALHNLMKIPSGRKRTCLAIYDLENSLLMLGPAKSSLIFIVIDSTGRVLSLVFFPFSSFACFSLLLSTTFSLMNLVQVKISKTRTMKAKEDRMPTYAHFHLWLGLSMWAPWKMLTTMST